MAEADLLTGVDATIHWEELSAFAERFPDVQAKRARFLIGDRRMTCSGAAATFDLMHHLIGETHGQALALEVAQLLMAKGISDRSESTKTDHAIALMEANIEMPLPIRDIALRCGQTQKALERRMLEAYGANPRTIYRRLRLNLARKLAQETDLTVSEIAVRSGYEDPSALTRALKAEFGRTPRQMRQQFKTEN